MERPIPRHSARLLEGRAPARGSARGSALRATIVQSPRPQALASVNFLTAHDGFTFNDLVTYNDKHNEANGEDNQDGSTDNRSWNCGAEGQTDETDINALRRARCATC